MKQFNIYLLTLATISLSLSHTSASQEVTGLDDWRLFIDPGHSQTENMGLYNYSEAEKVLRVAWALRDYLLDETDMPQENLLLARENDEQYVGLGERTDAANNWGADFYYSIHSDAGPPDINSTLMLYGGWKSNGELVEKTPEGGKDYGAILDIDLTSAMRIDNRGNYADRVFFQGDQHHHTSQFPFLWVNRETHMASLLSEAGFHTNPAQQKLNLNAEWKVLEALSAYRSFLEWYDIDRPEIGVIAGIITDIETGLAINGATVSIDTIEYTTDTYESLFHNHSNDPDELRNGFYFIQGLEPEAQLEVVFNHENYDLVTHDVQLANAPQGTTGENITFTDVQLTRNTPSIVDAIEPEDNLMDLFPLEPVKIIFDRKMNQQSVEEAFEIVPTNEGVSNEVNLSWEDEFTLLVDIFELEFEQEYTLYIDGGIAKNLLTDQFLDGNYDGEEGGMFEQVIKIMEEDLEPPVLVSSYPHDSGEATEIRPFIRLVYDETIDDNTISDNSIYLTDINTNEIFQGEIHHKVINNQSIVHFFPHEELHRTGEYLVNIEEGFADLYGNTTQQEELSFSMDEDPIKEEIIITDFEQGVNNWWHPQQAGQTTGIITDLVSRSVNEEVYNYAAGSTQSMRLNYAWDPGHAAPYIRQYLPPGASENNNRFNIDDNLQFYMYGDGSGNEFRIVIRDGAEELETHPWKKVDWKGWKLVSWDLANDPVVPWFGGDGVLDGNNFYIDGIHLRHTDAAAMQGALYFDKIRAVQYGELYVLWVQSEQEYAGTVDGAGLYMDGEEVMVSADAEPGYEFVKWTNAQDEFLSDQEQYTFEMPESNFLIKAHFEEETTLVKDMDPQPLTVFPNPATQTAYIEAQKVISEITITHLSGRKMKTVYPGQNRAEISLDGFSSGVYLIRATVDQQVVYKKFLIQKR